MHKTAIVALIVTALTTHIASTTEVSAQCQNPNGKAAETLIELAPLFAKDIKSKFYSLNESLSPTKSPTGQGCKFVYNKVLKTFNPEGQTETMIAFDEANIDLLVPEYIQSVKVKPGANGKVYENSGIRLRLRVVFKEPETLTNITSPEQKGPVEYARSEYVLLPPKSASSLFEEAGYSIPTISKIVE